MEYDPAYMNCSVKNPDSMFVEWFKDSKPLIEFHDLATRTTMGPDGSLMISPTLMTDLGEYKCVVKNLLGEKEEAKAYLNVQCEYCRERKIKFQRLIPLSDSRQSQSSVCPRENLFALWKTSSSRLSL